MLIACGAPRTPAPVETWTAPSADGIEQLAMSPSGSCGVLAGGKAHCWGAWSGALIKLGVPADQLADVAEIRIGHDVLGEQHFVDHLCVRDTRGQIQCWGNGHHGQLAAAGDSVPTPTTIEGLPPVAQLALGAHHTCALAASGDVLCWGSNEYGQLGIGKSEETIRRPTRVALPSKATQIVASHFDTCALLDNGDVRCWGENLRGEAGAPNPAAPGGARIAWTPYRVERASGARQLSAAYSTVCATKLDGAVTCWGYLTDKLGPAFATQTQGDVPDLHDATAVAVGYSHVCALRADRGVACWGTGAGVPGESWTPRAVALPGPAAQIVATEHDSCARLADRRWLCWGDNKNGAIAAHETTPVLTPVLLDLSRVD